MPRGQASRVRVGSWQTTNTSGWLPWSRRKRHAGIGRMEQRALPFDHVPMIGRRVRAQHLRGAGGEVGDDGIHRNAAAGDHDPGLAGGAEVGVDARALEGARDRERGIFLAERAIGADRQQPLAAALAAGRDRDIGRRRRGRRSAAGRAVPRRRAAAGYPASRACMPADDIEPRFERLEQRRDPGLRR